MLYQYDVGKHKNGVPYLVKMNSFKADQNDIVGLLINHLKLNELSEERVYLVSLDQYDRIMNIMLVGLGDYKSSKIYNRSMATVILLSGARKFVIAHNHPDGALFLSQDDLTNVNFLKLIAQLLEVDFVGSYVVTHDGYITNEMNKPVYFEKTEE